MVLLIVHFFVMFFGLISSLPNNNPCPNIFKYESSERNEIHGIMTFKNDFSGNYKVELKMVLPIQTNQNIGIKRFSSLYDVQMGKDVVFYVSFPTFNPVPEVDEIIFNGRLYCSMRHSLGPQYPALTFLSAFNAFSVSSVEMRPVQRPHVTQDEQYVVQEEERRPVQRPHVNHNHQQFMTQEPDNFFNFINPSTTPTPDIHSQEYFEQLFTQSSIKNPENTESNIKNPPLENRDGLECGISEDTQALVVHGTSTSEGQYPWLVAMFHLQKSETYKFKCAGNLISNNHVITAAHCVRHLNKPETLPHENIILVLGKHNIKSWATRSEIRDVKEIYVHPDYRQPSDADISIISMYKSSRCRCRLGEGRALQRVRSRTKEIKMPVVSQEDCLRADERFIQLTSNRTFCAGYRNGSGLCTGDSGGGFVMRHNGRWTLRGIVSAALVDPSTRSCDVNNYMVFSDVVRYKRWIERILIR
ncbi:hypothetical protein RI129_013006 [Pyrocoelia pectoralis]|uniref:Peptidase S1 domain-containing protein n=1 Tax=Pyrocoelia pectoralis TaxID=417401 RepID=A0AAN7V426_9COLE